MHSTNNACRLRSVRVPDSDVHDADGTSHVDVYFNNGTYMIVCVSDQWTVIRVVCVMRTAGRTAGLRAGGRPRLLCDAGVPLLETEHPRARALGRPAASVAVAVGPVA